MTPGRRKLIIDLMPSLIAAATAIVTSIASYEIAEYNIDSLIQSKTLEVQGSVLAKSLDIIASNDKSEAVVRARNILTTSKIVGIDATDVPNNVTDCVRHVAERFFEPRSFPAPPADNPHHRMTDKDVATYILDLAHAVDRNRDAYILAMTLLNVGCNLPVPMPK